MAGKNSIKRLYDFINRGVWTTNEEAIRSKPLRWLVRQLRVILYTARGITEHGSLMRPAALTFYTIMALVPILALAFAILKGFGAESALNDYFIDKFPQYGSLMSDILTYAEGLLTRTKGSIVALSGVAVLIWAAVKVFMNVENAFNRIWEVQRSRGWGRRIGAYVAMIFILPLLLVLFGGVSGYINDLLGDIEVKEYAVRLISLAIICSVFFLIYIVIPNTRVRPLDALKAALVAGTVFFLFQTGYFWVQRGVTTYNVIYGSFAAIPLFLIWAQSGWMILLYGAELSFAYQNIGSYMQERRIEKISYSLRRRITLAVMVHVVRNFVQGRQAATSEALAAELQLPVRMVRDVLYDLQTASLVVLLQSEGDERLARYMPARDVHEMTIYGVLDAIERNNDDDTDFSEYGGELATVSRILYKLSEEALGSPNNRKIVDIV